MPATKAAIAPFLSPAKQRSWSRSRSLTALSDPAAWLAGRQLLRGKVLDWKCGRGEDVRILRRQYGLNVRGWDPVHRPKTQLFQSFDTIMAIRALDAMEEPRQRYGQIAKLRAMLNPGGHLYVAVRDDWTLPGRMIHRAQGTYRIYEF